LKTVCIIGSGRMGSAMIALLSGEIKTVQYSRLNAENINNAISIM
jgi:3-hydroxyacyl-CoA dehydrogenase